MGGTEGFTHFMDSGSGVAIDPHTPVIPKTDHVGPYTDQERRGVEEGGGRKVKTLKGFPIGAEPVREGERGGV